MKRSFLVGLLAVGLVGLVVTPLAFQGPNLIVTDGSITRALEGDFANYTNTGTPFVRYFNATTYANESGGPTSILRLRLLTATYYDLSLATVYTTVYAAVQGEFASNLELTGVSLAYNNTGTYWNEYGSPLLNPTNITLYLNPNISLYNITWPGSTNVTYNGPQITSTNGTGSAALTPALVNETGKGPFYGFAFSAWLWTDYPLNPLRSSGFLGFRATVTGAFTPAVSVSILLALIDVPGGVWG